GALPMKTISQRLGRPILMAAVIAIAVIVLVWRTAAPEAEQVGEGFKIAPFVDAELVVSDETIYASGKSATYSGVMLSLLPEELSERTILRFSLANTDKLSIR